mgnify:CR=1 FL=1
MKQKEWRGKTEKKKFDGKACIGNPRGGSLVWQGNLSLTSVMGADETSSHNKCECVENEEIGFPLFLSCHIN